MNVVAEFGDPDTGPTLVFFSHHDAAHPGFVFNPAVVELAAGSHVRAAQRSESSEAGGSAQLFVMRPHANNFDCFFFIKDLINNSVLDICSS